MPKIAEDYEWDRSGGDWLVGDGGCVSVHAVGPDLCMKIRIGIPGFVAGMETSIPIEVIQAALAGRGPNSVERTSPSKRTRVFAKGGRRGSDAGRG